MGSTPYWGGIKSHSSHLAQHLRHAVSLWPVSPRCLPGVISGVWCGLPNAPWPRATASPPWGSMSTLKRGASHYRLGALLLLEVWARESLADDRPAFCTDAVLRLFQAPLVWILLGLGVEEWEEAPGRALYRSKVIPQERVETTLTPSAFPPLSRLPHCLPCCSPVPRVPGAAAGRLWVLSELRFFPPDGSLCRHLGFCLPTSL